MTVKQKQYIFFVSFTVVAFVAFITLLGLAFREDRTVKTAEVRSFRRGKPSDIQFKVESQHYEDGTYVISGWAVKPGVTYTYYNYGNDKRHNSVYNNMHLGFVDGNTVYILPTKLSQRDDVDRFMNDGIDYAYCGFTAELPKNRAGRIEHGKPVLIWKNPDESQEIYDLRKDGD